uniref:Uncharacterized protein n=1 Tax=Arundo donax TaxID=35708 RepID=A0A0A9DS42_ARUDO
MNYTEINLTLDYLTLQNLRRPALKWPANKLCNLQRSWDGRNDYFAGCSPGLKVGERLHNLREGERPLRVNDRLHLPGLEIRVELLQDGAIGGDHEPEPWRGDGAGEDHHAAALLHHLDSLLALTDCVEDDVVLLRQVFEVLLGVVDGDVSAQALEQLELLGAGRRGHLGGPVDMLCKLHST